jgi:hypothetical protein
MSTHIDDELPRLLTGEADRETVRAASTHLRSCPDCREELVAAVVAHASLSSAQRFAPEIMHGADLPDADALFARTRDEGIGAGLRRAAARRRLLVAAAAAVVIGGAAGTAIALNSSRPSGHTVALAAYGIGHANGSASFSGDRLTVDATSLPGLAPDQRYEVWLTDPARTRMQPVGWIGAGGSARLTVPGPLASSYTDIEVSVQRVDAPTYTYSGTSVLRGSYRK